MKQDRDANFIARKTPKNHGQTLDQHGMLAASASSSETRPDWKVARAMGHAGSRQSGKGLTRPTVASLPQHSDPRRDDQHMAGHQNANVVLCMGGKCAEAHPAASSG